MIGACLGIWAGLADASPASEATVLCQGIRLKAAIEPELADTERRLVCGDPEVQAGGAWKEIPAPQARYLLERFLQERGYYYPKFGREHEWVTVDPGEPARVSSFEVQGAPPELEPERRRKIVGERMTPSLLDSAEHWVKQRLQALGYPCSEISSEGERDTGVLRVLAKAGPLQNLIEVIEGDSGGLAPGTLRRYDAFQFRTPFDGDGLMVTEGRIMSLGLFQSYRLAGSCGSEGAIVREEIVAGPPRLLRLGVGLNTEGVLLGRASWRNTRLGPRGSWLDLTAQGSAKEQRVELSANAYLLTEPSRKSLRPALRFKHENEIHFETLEARAQLAGATTYDSRVLGLKFQAGPSIEEIRTLRGVGPASSRLLSLESQLLVREHGYEQYASSPRTGWEQTLGAAFGAAGWGSSGCGERISWGGHLLWNYREYDPPLWVFGTRWAFKTTASDSGAQGLAPAILHFLGGSADLRGFGRRELPGPQGALTSLYLGLEARLAQTLPAGIEPFGFLDLGALGADSFALDDPTYGSPGFGIRWASPIGAVRTTLARGISNGMDPRWQFYLSLGEEF